MSTPNKWTSVQKAIRHRHRNLTNWIVPVGRRSSITFADGTRLWVNSGPKVVYPVKFAKEKREIFAEGEIYLHVSRDEQKPFIVKTHQDGYKGIRNTIQCHGL
ncbi:MAG: FecR domain-containing protein [Parabacteroides merdae]